MKCTVGNENFGVWCRCIHSLAQVGDDDIYFDCSDTILTLSTFNSSLSNYATFLFFRQFFTSYQMTSDEPEKVVIPSKIILKPYRTLKLAKNYLSSEIKYAPNDDYVLVTSEGKSHVSSCYKLGATATTDEIQFDCDPYAFKNYLKADAKVLSNCLSNFTYMKGLAELTLKIHGNKVTLKNTVTDLARKDGSVVTEYNLSYHDFMDYEIQGDGIELSFGFREFKVFTTFAEQLKLPMTIHFQGPNDPVVVTVKTDTFEARLGMATRICDPFASDLPQGSSNGPASGSNGRISSVSSQASSRNISSQGSSRHASHEINRRRDNGTLDAAVRNISPTIELIPPPAKRLRRTDFQEARLSDLGDNDQNPICLDIEPLVERLEKRSKSVGYKSIHRFATGPTLTAEEYLRNQPGHDVVLCPDSDEDEG